MPAPRQMARFNRVITNRIGRPVAVWFPGLGVVEHIGRKSGRVYRTPVAVFRKQDGLVIALFYGVEAEWLKNVLVAGGCVVTTRGQKLRLGHPEVYHDETKSAVPLWLRPFLALLKVNDFLRLS